MRNSEMGDRGKDRALNERVRVTVRVRPFSKHEHQKEREKCRGNKDKENQIPVVYVKPEKCTVTVRRKPGCAEYTEFTFDAVLSEKATQAEVYKVAAQPIVLDVLEGYNGTIMAYGQTGAGKTYTLSDVAINEESESRIEGIIPRSAANIFEYTSNDADHEYRISMCYIQIYLEMIHDLLNPESSNLQIREDENGGIFIAGAREIEIKSLEDVVTLLMLGDCNRQCAFTKLNAHSSRSHAIVIITVEKKTVRNENAMGMSSDKKQTPRVGIGLTEKILVGKLFLVDLAGSERLKKSGSEGLRATEAMSVNMSLTALGKCISARAHPLATHIPFRDSKLTRLLQESLGGNTKTSLIINIAPCSEYIHETLSSLQFGMRALKVGSRAILNFEEEFRILNKNILEEPSEAVTADENSPQKESQKISSEHHNSVWNNDSEEGLDSKNNGNGDDSGYKSSEMEARSKASKSCQEGASHLNLKDVSVNCGEDEIRDLQSPYKQEYVDELQNEKREVELVAGAQLMANSAARVLKSLDLIDEFFTKM